MNFKKRNKFKKLAKFQIEEGKPHCFLYRIRKINPEINLNYKLELYQKKQRYSSTRNEELEKKLQNENKLKATPKYNNNFNNNTNNVPNQNSGSNRKRSKNINNGNENKDTNNGQFNMKSYARRLSKMNISSTNWNINQLGDMLTYPDVMEIEA